MATEYGGAYGGQPWHGGQPSYGSHPPAGSQPRHPGRGRAGLAAAIIALVLGVAGLIVSLVGVATQLLPREFTAAQQRQITDWEAGRNWRQLQAGKIFPAVVSYAPPTALDDDTKLALTARRIGIARQASCTAGTDAAVAAVLSRDGCLAMLRATYVDGTDSYVVTVGVAIMPGSAQASAADRQLAGRTGFLGVRAVRFTGTPAAWFTNARRQLSGSIAGDTGTYVFLYTIGYADDRPRVLVTADSYADSEMTSVGEGVARAVGSVLAAPVAPPHCPGTPGC